MKHDHSEKIRRNSKALRYAALTLMWLFPTANGLFWIFKGFPAWSEMSMIPNIPAADLTQLSGGYRLLGFFVNMLPIAFEMWALWHLSRLFGQYEKLEFFSKSCVRHIRKMGLSLGLLAATHPLYMVVISLAVTLSNAPGQRTLMVGFGSTQIFQLGVALAVLIISWVMDEGRKLHEEQQLTV